MNIIGLIISILTLSFCIADIKQNRSFMSLPYSNCRGLHTIIFLNAALSRYRILCNARHFIVTRGNMGMGSWDQDKKHDISETLLRCLKI
jgi:hypothetical protein